MKGLSDWVRPAGFTQAGSARLGSPNWVHPCWVSQAGFTPAGSPWMGLPGWVTLARSAQLGSPRLGLPGWVHPYWVCLAGSPRLGPFGLDLSNRPGHPFWLVAQPEKRRAGPARPSTVVGWAGTAQKERAVLGQGCQPACHAGRPTLPAHRADPPCRPTVPAHRAGPPC